MMTAKMIPAVLWFAVIGVFVSPIGETRSFGASLPGQTIQAFCIDFNWGEGGPNAFAAPGLWADADPEAHIAWYESLGANVVQTFAVSCNGFAWYKGGVVPEQPGLKHDFLTEMVKLGHARKMKVMGYFCVGANTRWGQLHPEQSYGTPSHTHIPLTNAYVDFLCASIKDALIKTDMDGFMIDWFFHGTYRPADAPLKWLPCEQKMWGQLMDGPFPGVDNVTAEQEIQFKRRSVERCWIRLRAAAKTVKPDCIIWLSCHDLKHPQLVDSKVFQEVDWLMNEAGDLESLRATKHSTGPHTRLITCVVGWGDRHNALAIVPNARDAGIGIYGFAKPRSNSMPLPIAQYQSKPIVAFDGNDRNIAALSRTYNGLPFDRVKDQTGQSVVPRPSPQQYVWHEQERIQFVCLDPCTWQGREYDNHSTDLKTMTLPKLDTDQWCEAAKAWGAKEILFVAKHTGGFCWWQTDTSDYSVKNIAWKDGKGDLLEEVAKSCGKVGLNIGIYVYPGDDTWGAGIGSGGKTRDPAKQEAYNRVFRQQLREALQIAGKQTKVTEIWFDGSCIIDVGDVMREEAPEAVILQGPYANLRWVGSERGSMLYDKSWCTVNRSDLETGVSTSFHSTPDGDVWAPCEVNTTLYDHHWFWSKANESRRKSRDELMRVFYESVGQGSVMLLNSTPNTDGLIPEDDMKMYQALGAEIERRFGKPIAQTAGSGSEYVIDLKHPTTVNHVMMMEDYRHGERVRKFMVEGWDGKAWKPLAEGAHVGRKQIAFFDDAVVSKLRLRITASVAEPLIKSFAAYHVTDFKKPAIGRQNPWRASDASIAENKQAIHSNWRTCGKWTADDFENGSAKLKIDLTGKITVAGQWQVKFMPDDSNVKLTFGDEALLQQGQASVPGVLAQSKENPLLFNINRTAVVTEGTEDIRLNLTITGGASNGIVFVRKR